MSIPSRRPRVWLIDFETAIEFADTCPPEDRVSMGPPIGGSISEPDEYKRACPPEVLTGKPYDPFKLDVWQFGNSIQTYKVSLSSISLFRVRFDHIASDRNSRHR